MSKPRYRTVVRPAVRTAEDPATLPWQERHQQRLDEARARLQEVTEAVGRLGLWLRAGGDQGHWVVTYHERGSTQHDAAVEWWPRTARCVLRSKYDRPLKVYDVPGFLKVCRMAANMPARSTGATAP